MIVSFTQTYGDGRTELFEIYSRDKRLIEFKNLFDMNIYSFHNCSIETIEYFKSLNKVKNTKYLEFNNMSYGDTIIELLKYLKEINCTHFFFSQDDTFSADNDNIDFNELYNYMSIHNTNFMLSLRYKIFDYFFRKLSYDIEYTKLKSFNVHHTSSIDCVNMGIWGAMDDQPFLCTIDMLNKIYGDIEYVNKGNIWDMEQYIATKYTTTIINRYMTEDILFKNYNLYGRETKYTGLTYDELKLKKLIF